MNWPKKDHWEKVGTVTRPVTHTADAAVKSASINRVSTPGAEAAGSIRRKVPQRIETRKPYARILVAEKGFFLNTVLPSLPRVCRQLPFCKHRFVRISGISCTSPVSAALLRYQVRIFSISSREPSSGKTMRSRTVRRTLCPFCMRR